jgi:excisionase family DNA binding protein
MKKTSTLTIPATAKRLGFTLKYVYDLVYSGRLKAEKVAGRWQVDARAVEARLQRRGQS